MCAARSAASLLVLGDDPSTRLLADLARQLDLPAIEPGHPGARRRRPNRPVVAVIGRDVEQADLDRSLEVADVAFLSPGSEPAADRSARFAAADLDPGAGRPLLGAAALAAWSPVVVAAGREIASLGALGHLEVHVRLAGGGGLADALTLAAWSLAGSTIDAVAATADDRAQLRATAPSGAPVTASADARPATVPEWSLQAASAAAVVRLELAPSLALERDGRSLPTGDDPTADGAVRATGHLGLLGFLDDLRSGRLLDPRSWPPGAHPAWGLQVCRLLAAHAASLAREGAPVDPATSR